MKKVDPAPIRRRLASRRDQVVVCDRCGARVERRMRGQRFCSARCRERARWLTDRETSFAMHQRLIDLGLVEPVPGRPDTWQDTPVGKEVDIELFEVFIGLVDVWDAQFILERRCLVSQWEADDVYERMSRQSNPESVLLGYVRRAYFDYRSANKFLH